MNEKYLYARPDVNVGDVLLCQYPNVTVCEEIRPVTVTGEPIHLPSAGYMVPVVDGEGNRRKMPATRIVEIVGRGEEKE